MRTGAGRASLPTGAPGPGPRLVPPGDRRRTPTAPSTPGTSSTTASGTRRARCCASTATRPGPTCGAACWRPPRPAGAWSPPTSSAWAGPSGSTAPRSLQQRVADLGDLTAALGVSGPVVTVGHDWGGAISLGWALRAPAAPAGRDPDQHRRRDARRGPGPVLIRLANAPGVRAAVTVGTPMFVRATTALSRPALPADVRRAFAAPYRSAARRRSVGDFVADIPFSPGHPSRAVQEAIAEGDPHAGRAGPAALGPARPGLRRAVPGRPPRPPAAGAAAPLRGRLTPADRGRPASTPRPSLAGSPTSAPPSAAPTRRLAARPARPRPPPVVRAGGAVGRRRARRSWRSGVRR